VFFFSTNDDHRCTCSLRLMRSWS